MNWIIFRSSSLKTRVTLFTLAIFLIGIWSLAFYASRTLQGDIERLLGDQQFSTVSILASEINHALDDRLRALEDVAGKVTPDTMGSAAALQAFLEQRPAFQSLFNGGVVAYRLDGTAIADVPVSVGRVGVNYMDRDYVVGALKQGKATIGRPVMGRQLRSPAFAMAVPVRDTQGKVIGALAGVTNLGKSSFLDRITENRYAKTGDYLLVAPQHRLIITASEKRRIMELLPAPGVIPQIDRFLQGDDGTSLYVNPRGVEVLTSSTGIPVAGWQLAAILPTAEAFAPIRAMQQRMLLAAMFLTLLAGALTWWMLRRQLAPMLAAARTLATLSDTNQTPQPLPVTSQDEIGDLIGGFNRLLETLRQREDTLQESEARFKTMFNEAPLGIALIGSLTGHIYSVNPMFAKIAGRTMEEMANIDWISITHPEDVQRDLDNMALLNAGKITGYHLEKRYLHRDGAVVWINMTIAPVYAEDKAHPLHLCMIEDITERKRMEDQVRQLAFHDALTNLPNRRLLNDRLSQTIAAGKRSGGHGAMMFLDLDNFKSLNDTHGHEVGDLLLIEAADRLKSCVREMDTVARFGGDEFVVMIPELGVDRTESATRAGIIAEKVRAVLATPYVLKVRHEGEAETTVEHQCTASIGVAMFSKHEASQEDILKWADTAMYQAKEAGCDLIRFYASKA